MNEVPYLTSHNGVRNPPEAYRIQRIKVRNKERTVYSEANPIDPSVIGEREEAKERRKGGREGKGTRGKRKEKRNPDAQPNTQLF